MDSVLKVNKIEYGSRTYERYERFLIQERLMSDICFAVANLKNEIFIKSKSEYEIEVMRGSLLKYIEKYYNTQEKL